MGKHSTQELNVIWLLLKLFLILSATRVNVCLCFFFVTLQSLAPAVDWMPYLTEVFAPVPLNESEPVVVYATEYLQKVSDLITKTNKRSVIPVFYHLFVRYRSYTTVYKCILSQNDAVK